MSDAIESNDTSEVAAIHEHPGQELPQAPDNVKPIESAKQKKPNKHEQKQIQKFLERMRRHMARGLSQEQAQQLIAKEDYDNLSPDKKIARMETLIGNLFNMLQKDITNLRHNDGELAFAMDVNLKAFAKIMAKLGVPVDEQQVFVAEAEAEIKAEEEAKKAAAEKIKKDQAEVEEKARQAREEAALLAKSKEPSTEPSEQPSLEHATEFSG